MRPVGAHRRRGLALLVTALVSLPASGVATNFESSHVHPIARTPTGARVVAVNTPDAVLEVFQVLPDGTLAPDGHVPVGLEPVSVSLRNETEAWVVNHLSDSVSIVDLATRAVTRTLAVGDEPTDVAFAGGFAFVAVAQEDAVKRYQLADLDAAPETIELLTRDVRALAVSNDGQTLYAVALRSGNGTTVVNANIIFNGNSANLNGPRLAALGLRDMACSSTPPAYPPLPPGIERNPALNDPPASTNPAQFPRVGLIVGWNESAQRFEDEVGADWSPCLPFTLPDRDLFMIDVATLAVTDVRRLGTALFDVSVHPSGRIYVPNTDSRNLVRFEHPLGVRGHVVDNRLSVVDPAAGHALTVIDLNSHVDRLSDPAANLAERLASVSQPGMLVWTDDGATGYLTALGSRKVFRVDGTCMTDSCIFGADRAAPAAAVVGDGPSGLVLDESRDRLYVVNRISNSISVVEASTMTTLTELPLHDPTPPVVAAGRRLLYDAIDGSGHGDAACSSCHLSGDTDGLAWDLGNPAGAMVPYSTPLDNVRFVVPQGGQPVECDPAFCAAHDGFDPQKGPLVTQTLRGMLEPLHWRGDRATMLDFNQAFVTLMGTADIGPINGAPAGVSGAAMAEFREFALAIAHAPNPHRLIDDTTPCGPRATDPGCEVMPHGLLRPGNPTEGALLFDSLVSDAGQPCSGCHAAPFGAAGGVLGGLEPEEPTSPSAPALFFGTADGSPHNDLKIPHLRTMYDRFGPVWADPLAPPPETRTGFGFTHDGSVPDLFRFLSSNVFSLSTANQARQVRDLVSFMAHFPTGTRPAVGQALTLAPGVAPTGSTLDEARLATLLALGDRADPDRHCELVAHTAVGASVRGFAFDGGVFVADAAADPALSIEQLRESASSPVSFLCAPLESGRRLGIDRDEDLALDRDDCAPADGGSSAVPVAVVGLTLDEQQSLAWEDQAAEAGAGTVYDVLGADLTALRTTGIDAVACLADGGPETTYTDPRPDPAPGQGVAYLIRPRNGCGPAPPAPGRESLAGLGCP